MTLVYNTHKFLYTLYHEGNIKGKKVIYIDSDNKEKEVIINDIKITNSPISCKIIDNSGKEHKIMFFKVKKVFDENGELIWENEVNLDNVKVIKGYK
jgi:hypothetical protein